MDPQIPVCFDPKIPLADSDEDRHLRDGVGAEVVQLHSIVLVQRPHESADGDAESLLVEPREAHDVALGGIRFGLLRPRGNPRRPLRVDVHRQQPVGDQLLQYRRGGGGLPPRQRLLDIRHRFEPLGDAGRQALRWLRCALALSFFLLSLSALGLGCRGGGKGRGDEGKMAR